MKKIENKIKGKKEFLSLMIILNYFYKKTWSFFKSKYFWSKLITLNKKIFFVVSFPRSGQSPIIDYIKIIQLCNL